MFKPGHVYEAKKPKVVGFYYDDRQILHIGLNAIQYDSPTVAPGKKYPSVSKEKFAKWAGRDITDEMPKGEWRMKK